MSDYILEIADLAKIPGRSRQIRARQTIEGLAGGLALIEVTEPVEFDLSAEGLVDGIAVTGSVSGKMHISCSRCLAGFDQSFDQAVDEVYYYEGADEREGYEVQGEVIDLEPMLRDVIVLSMPMTPLHATDCAGLCPVCGQDRNLVECGHDQKPKDYRWAPLADLAKTLPGTLPETLPETKDEHPRGNTQKE
ncbi:MAG: DUF177 domain-containing protein [Actinomycetota bacterium]